MTNTERKQLQKILGDKNWPFVENCLEEFLKENFLQASVKKDTEFDTMWYLAFAEGGKYYLQQFFARLEDEASRAE